VDDGTGRRRRLARPGATWEPVELVEESDGDPGRLFEI